MIRKLAVVAAASAMLAGCASTHPVHTSALGGPDTGQSTVVSKTVARTASRKPIVVWYRDVGPRINRAERSIALAQRAVNRPHHRGLYAACGTIKTRAQVVQRSRPAPDRIVRHAFAREMTHFVKGANYCRSGQLLAAGRSVDFGHYWSRIADNRLLKLLRHAS